MKKGMTRTLNSLIIVAVVAIFLFVFVGPLIAKITETGSREACRLSMLAKTKTSIEVLRTVPVTESPIAPICPRYTLTFHDDKLETRKGVKDQKDKYYEELTDLIVNREIGEQLRACWYQFGAGKMDSFWSPNWFFGDLGDDLKLCYICSEISFDESVKTKKFTGFYLYLHDHTLSGQKEGDGLKLYDYLAESGGFCQDKEFPGANCWEGYAEKMGIEPILEFNKDKKYAVLFIRHGQDKEATTHNSYVIPVNEMNEQCDAYVS